MRPRHPSGASLIRGALYLNTHRKRVKWWIGFDRESVKILENNSLHFLDEGIFELYYDDPNGSRSILPIPIAKNWDTHVFIVTDEGRPLLGTASVSMRPAGAGFDPSDALIDAYERGIADLVTGGRGPDSGTLDNLLWGKYRNPLFGLLGAHFLIRELRRDTELNPDWLERLSIVIRNLGTLLGATAPDVVALRIWKQLISKEPLTERFPSNLPLFNVGFQAFIEATAVSDKPTKQFDAIALGLDANSPWTVFSLRGKPEFKGRLIHPYLGLSDIPEQVVKYMRDAIEQSKRTGQPLNFPRLVRRTMLPKSVLVAAKAIVEQRSTLDGDGETIRQRPRFP